MEPHFQKYPESFDDNNNVQNGTEGEETNTDRPLEVPQKGMIMNRLKKYQIYKRKDFWSRLDPPYRRVHAFLQKTQIGFAIGCAIVTLLVPEIRDFIIVKPWSGRAIVFMTEFSSWALLTYVLGLKRIPINYISLVIMRFFLMTDTATKPNYGSRMVRNAKHAKSIGNEIDEIDESLKYIKNLSIIGIFLALSYVITRFSTIQVAKMESLALMGSFVSSSLGTLVLISSLAVDRLGRENHLILSQIWSYSSFVVTFSLALFLFQRAFPSRNNQLSQMHFSRVQFEVLICLVQIYIVSRYIPVIHPGFSFTFRMKKEIPALIAVIPNAVQPIFLETIPALLLTIFRMMENYHMAFPYVLMESTT